MKKNLFPAALLALATTASAQIMTHVDNTATFYVGEGALVYNGGGMQTKGSGVIDVRGNVMVVGTAGADKFRTVDAANADLVTPANNIILRLNDPANYATSTYGQLYISGLNQSDITGFVTKEYRDISHGGFQQMAIPFAAKTINSVALDLGKSSNFSGGRNASALGYMDNTRTVMRVVNPSSSTDAGDGSVLYGPTTYFAAGVTGWNPSASTKNVQGRPYADTSTAMEVQLVNGGKPNGTPINYGSTGQNQNTFGEKYASYINDPFDTPAWSATYGKELYQYGNPFLTNIDLSWIGTEAGETGLIKDGNRLPVQGIRYSLGGVTYSPTTGSTTPVNSTVTFSHSAAGTVPAGDVNNLVIKPMGAVYIKLNPELETQYPGVFTRSLDFNTLRRFNKTARAASTDYSVSAAKSGASSGTLKQIGVIALDSQDRELGRTYYVVASNAVTGFNNSGISMQASTGFSNNVPSQPVIYTNEEFTTGGIDPTYASVYNLYINEANEANFLSKRIPLKLNSTAISKLKFEIRENAALLPDAQDQLSTGESFWIQQADGTNVKLAQNQTLNASLGDLGLYYGQPQPTGALGVNEINNSTTVVAYDQKSDHYTVLFDKNWKKADITIYDMSGKLINVRKDIRTTSNHILDIPKGVKNAYIVVIQSDNGQEYKTKLMR